MKVLIVCSGTSVNSSPVPFIGEQMEALSGMGVKILLFQIKKGGITGYLSHLLPLRKLIKQEAPDLIHAHYGLSGLLANLQRKVPVITTFHGSDINDQNDYRYSRLAYKLSAASIFVEKSMMDKMPFKDRSFVIPCGIDLSIFKPVNKEIARDKLGMNINRKYALFSSSFSRDVKNYPLAKSAIEKTNNEIEILELKNKTREEVALLLNAVDFLLLTSFSEGSPQIIKEAMACNCPIVTTKVGDIADIIGITNGCFITTFNSDDIAQRINDVLNLVTRTNGRENVMRFDNKLVSSKVLNVYNLIYLSLYENPG